MILSPQPTWLIHDASKLQDYMDCPRLYFWKYVLGWKSTQPNVHLEFGTAWHLAMEHLIVNGYDELSVMQAWHKLKTHYRQFFPEIMDDSYHPKTPAMAMKALNEYVREYAHETFKPLYTEIAGSVTLTKELSLHFKMDSILETQDGVKSREHKTGSQLSRQWIDQWALKMQTGVYNHVLYCLFPPEAVWGVEINGAIFSKKEVKFTRVPSRRTLQAMEVWYWNTIWWIEEIERNFQLLESCSPYDTILRCFKMNTESCTKYFGCAFHDFCTAWPNPLARLDDRPDSFKIEYWNPVEEEKEAKHIFRIEDGQVKEETKSAT